MLNFKKFKFASIIFVLLLTITGCTNEPNQNKYKISIAEQYGLAYAPLQIVKKEKILEKKLPGINVEWQQLGNTTEIREAMLAKKVDAGFMAIPPFLIGLDKGMEWKIATGLSSSPVGLVTHKETIKSLKDFTKADRIALPQPGSVQHILLSMACERELGDSHKLDNLLVTMKHPDGMNALLAKKEITAHFTSMPYLYEELKNKEIHQILSGKEAMGQEFSFIVGVTTKKFHDTNPEIYNAFVASIEDAINFITSNPEKSSESLAQEYNLPKDQILKYLTWSDTEYSTTVKGVKGFANFMVNNGYIAKPINQIEKVLWEDVKYEE